MIWHNPEAFLLFLPFLGVLFWIQRKKSSSGLFYSSLSLFEGVGESLRQRLSFIPFALKAMALTLMIVALARPLSTQDREKQDRRARDILLILDISRSMLDMEGGISRLEASKKVIRDFIEGRAWDRIGLVVFSGESFTEVPLTFDHIFLKSRLRSIQPLEELEQGTAIGVALVNGLARLQSSPAKSRAIVLLTDGDNNAGFIDPETAAFMASETGIKIYSIGLGKKSGKRLLKKISSQTGGMYFSAENPKILERIFKKIDQLESYQVLKQNHLGQKELFEAFLSPGLILYLLSLLLSLTLFFKEV